MTMQPERTDKPPATAEPTVPAPSPVPDARAEGSPPAPALPHHTIKRTRISSTWAAITCFAVLLLLLLIFILQNSRSVDVSYFGAHGHLPLGVALLLSAVAGVLLIALPGSARIMQLRIIARRHRRDDTRQHLAARPADPASPGRGPGPTAS